MSIAFGLTSSVKPTRRMMSFCVFNICRQCLKSVRLGNTFPPHGSFRMLETKGAHDRRTFSNVSRTGTSLDHPSRSSRAILSPSQRTDSRRNETFVHQDRAERREIFPVGNRTLELQNEDMSSHRASRVHVPPTMRPVSVKFNCRYFPKRLEL